MRFTSLLARGLRHLLRSIAKTSDRVVGVWNLKELAIVRRSCRPSLFIQVFAQHDYPATTALDNHALTSRYFIEELNQFWRASDAVTRFLCTMYNYEPKESRAFHNATLSRRHRPPI